MKLLKKTTVITGIAVAALTSFAVFAKMGAAPGYHVLNGNNIYAFATANPGGCAGIMFPTPLAPTTMSPNSDNTIKVDPTAAGTQVCSTLYFTTTPSDAEHNPPCLVSLHVTDGVITELKAVPVQKVKYMGVGCTAKGGVDVLITSSS